MNIVKKIAIVTVFFIAIIFQTNSLARHMGPAIPLVKSTVSAPVARLGGELIEDSKAITAERENNEYVIIEKRKRAAIVAINSAQDKLAKGEISQIEAAKIIGEHNYIIDQTEKRLNELVQQSVPEIPESYMSGFIAKVQDIGARLLAPFKAFYSYPEEKKDIAQAIIVELNKRFEIVEQEYIKKMQAAMSNQEKFRLRNEFNRMKKDFENEIYQQKLITGEEISAEKKIWAGIGLAGVISGAILARRYFEQAKMEKPIVPRSTAQDTVSQSFQPSPPQPEFTVTTPVVAIKDSSTTNEETPSTINEETPSTINEETPSTINEETPSTTNEETPSTAKKEISPTTEVMIKNEEVEYPGLLRHIFNQIISDIKSVRKGEIPRPIKYKEREGVEYPGLLRHIFDQIVSDIKSVREGKIPRPIRYKKSK